MEEQVMKKELPLQPDKEEKKYLRKLYTKAGLMALLVTIILQLSGAIISNIFVVYMIKRGITIEEIQGMTTGLSKYILIINIITYAMAYPIILMSLKGISKFRISSFFSKKNIDAKLVLKYVAMGFGIFYAGNYISAFINIIFLNNGISLFQNSPNTIPGDFTSRILAILLLCVLAPIMEEIVFRGFLLKGFITVSPKFAIIVTAVVFGMTHGNVIQCIGAIPFGLFCGYVAYKTGSVIPTIFMHVFVNSFGVFSGFLLNDIIEKMGTEKGTIAASMIIGCIAMVLLCIAVISIICNKKNRIKLTETKIQKNRTFGILFQTWPIYVIILLFVLFAIKSSSQVDPDTVLNLMKSNI